MITVCFMLFGLLVANPRNVGTQAMAPTKITVWKVRGNYGDLCKKLGQELTEDLEKWNFILSNMSKVAKVADVRQAFPDGFFDDNLTVDMEQMPDSPPERKCTMMSEARLSEANWFSKVLCSCQSVQVVFGEYIGLKQVISCDDVICCLPSPLTV